MVHLGYFDKARLCPARGLGRPDEVLCRVVAVRGEEPVGGSADADDQGACILTGAGFNGYDPKTGRTLWNRLRNVNIPAIETAESFKVLFDSWNCRTNVSD